MPIEFKKLPRHWIYPLQRSQAKALLARVGADFRSLQFLGAARKPTKLTPGLFTVGYLDGYQSDSRWCFRLRLYGLPEEVFLQASKAPGDLISSDIQTFVNACLGDTLRGYGRNVIRIYFFREKGEDLVPEFATRRPDGLSKLVAQFDQWWLGAPAA